MKRTNQFEVRKLFLSLIQSIDLSMICASLTRVLVV